MRLNRGTVHTWRRRWLALAPKLEQIEADGGHEKVLTTMIVEALTDHPRSGTPATFTAEQIVAVYLHPADKYHRLTRRPLQGQKGLEERALIASL